MCCGNIYIKKGKITFMEKHNDKWAELEERLGGDRKDGGVT